MPAPKSNSNKFRIATLLENTLIIRQIKSFRMVNLIPCVLGSPIISHNTICLPVCNTNCILGLPHNPRRMPHQQTQAIEYRLNCLVTVQPFRSGRDQICPSANCHDDRSGRHRQKVVCHGGVVQLPQRSNSTRNKKHRIPDRLRQKFVHPKLWPAYGFDNGNLCRGCNADVSWQNSIASVKHFQRTKGIHDLKTIVENKEDREGFYVTRKGVLRGGKGLRQISKRIP